MDRRNDDAIDLANEAAAHGAAVIAIPETTEDRRDAVMRGYQILTKPFRARDVRALIDRALA